MKRRTRGVVWMAAAAMAVPGGLGAGGCAGPSAGQPAPAAAAPVAAPADPAPAAPAPAPADAAPAPAPAPAAAAAATGTTKTRVEVDEGGKAVFQAHGVGGAFVLLDVGRGVISVVNPDEAGTRYTPASTFKIPNTLIGLETGVIPDERFTLRWDGKKRWNDAWNRDHDLPSAMKYSVVWFYQEVARRIGAQRMQSYVDRFDYGNRDTSGGIDAFWLGSSLRISPLEQIEFLRRLRGGELPVRPEHAALVRRLITLEETPGHVLQGKTGMATQDDGTVGWLVGFVEQGGASYVYATVLLAKGDQMSRLQPLRLAITKELLGRRGLLGGPAGG